MYGAAFGGKPDGQNKRQGQIQFTLAESHHQISSPRPAGNA